VTKAGFSFFGRKSEFKRGACLVKDYRTKDKDADRDRGSCEERLLEKVLLERVQEGEW
jgi:hypothetical protein